MRENIKKCKSYLMALLLALFVGGISFFGTSMSVEADPKELINPDFGIEAELLSSDEDTYNIRLSVENKGKDWEGTVRVLVSESYYVPSAYDTSLSLPQGSEKQFVVKVPKGGSDSTDGSITVVLLDKKSKAIAAEEFKKFLAEEMDCIAMGILSDEYSSLTYLDMGGSTLYYYGSNLPIKLAEVTQDNLMDSLDSLTILVIDKYNTSVLSDEEIKAISLWIDNGGVLLVGTGSDADNILAGLEDILPEIKSNSVVKANSGVSVDNLYGERALDVTQLDMAQLQADMNQYYESYFCYGYTTALGDGAVGVMPYSLADLSKAGEDVYRGTTQEVYVLNMLEEVTSTANSRYSKTNSATKLYESMSLTRRLLGILGNIDSTLNFGVLRFLVILYVILVGPILYLILKFAKKREWYWVAVPCTALAGIAVVFFAGRGFEVVDTRVYSVTTQDLTSQDDSKTYMYCYDADHTEWNLQLGDDYEYVGPLLNENYDYTDRDNLNYYHHIKNEGDKLSFGIKPSSSFEDSYFYAGKKKEDVASVGNLGVIGVDRIQADVEGEIVNDTGKDFLYYAVIVYDTLYVYKDLPAGGKVSLDSQVPIYNAVQSYSSDYIYDFLRSIIRDTKSQEDVAALSALGIGIYEAYPVNDIGAVVVCGVTTDWEKTVDDDCNEVSYGCLYVVQ